MKRALASSTHPDADEAASEVLRDGASALAAALAGFFAAAGVDPGVLFSPLTILVGGGGVGARAFDGRSRQPGVGAKRPRGYTNDATIPEAARAAVPAGIAASVVASAYAPGAPLGAAIRRGIALARKAGCRRRASVLERVAAVGAGVLADPLVRGTLLGGFGPAEGGLIGSGDLAPPRHLDTSAAEEEGAWAPPWASEVGPEEARGPWGERHTLSAVDAQGVFVGLSFFSCTEGFELSELELVLPKLAVPVRRGVPRLEPGAPLRAPAPLAIRRDAAGRPIELAASPKTLRLGAPEILIRRDPRNLEVSVFRG